MPYYAVRYKTAADQIRIEKARTPEQAFRLAFGVPAVGSHSPPITEYKDLGASAAILRSDARRIAALNDPNGWVTFQRREISRHR